MKMIRIAALASLAFSVACGATCEDYADALEACASDFAGDAAGDSAEPDFGGTCDLIGDGNYDWKCAVDAIEAEDCSTIEGLTAAQLAVGSCAG